MLLLNDLAGFNIAPQRRKFVEAGGVTLADNILCQRGTSHEWDNLAYLAVGLYHSISTVTYSGDRTTWDGASDGNWGASHYTNANEEHVGGVMGFRNVTPTDYEKVADNGGFFITGYIRLIGGSAPATFVNYTASYGPASIFPQTLNLTGLQAGDFVFTMFTYRLGTAWSAVATGMTELTALRSNSGSYYLQVFTATSTGTSFGSSLDCLAGQQAGQISAAFRMN